MTVEQIGSTENSVTIEISGIPNEYNRQTTIKIPRYGYSYKSQSISEWIDNQSDLVEMTLGDARAAGYITDIITDIDDNNGTIQIIFNTSWLEVRERKAWSIRVSITQDAGDGTQTVVGHADIVAFTGFSYDGEQTKIAGHSIDVTANDMRSINMLAFQIGYVTSPWNEEYLLEHCCYDTLISKGTGDEISAEYLYEPACIVADISTLLQSSLPYYLPIYACASDVYDRCDVGVDFEAQFFNKICIAFQNFKLKVTV